MAITNDARVDRAERRRPVRYFTGTNCRRRITLSFGRRNLTKDSSDHVKRVWFFRILSNFRRKTNLLSA